LGALAERLHAVREGLRRRWPESAARRRALDAALAPGGPLDPLREDTAGGVDGWLAGASPDFAADRTAAIVLRSDDPDDLTLREARLLGSADVIRHAPDIPEAILARARADARRRPLADAPGDSGAVVEIRRPSPAQAANADGAA
ncbi:MAG: siroheme synthase, partial [Novosphingobium sp.]